MRMCWPRLGFIAIVVVLGTSSMLASCGQKGDLYLPDDDAPSEQG